MLLWSRDNSELAGAYRIARSDEILWRYGRRGLYTHSLFRYGRELLQGMPPALELGRSFVRAEYQRNFAPLMPLWKGVAEFVVRHPRYRVLFGPVSISNEYSRLSRLLLVDYLREHSFQHQLARYVKPRQSFRDRMRAVLRHDIDLALFGGFSTVEEMVTEIEPDQKGPPFCFAITSNSAAAWSVSTSTRSSPVRSTA